MSASINQPSNSSLTVLNTTIPYYQEQPGETYMNPRQKAHLNAVRAKQARQSSLLLGRKKRGKQLLSRTDDQLRTRHAAQSNIGLTDILRFISFAIY